MNVLIDNDILFYALYDTGHSRNKKALSWLAETIESKKEVIISAVTLLGFVRIFTNPKKTKSFTIKEIIRMNALNALEDSVGFIYYNGKPTLEAKVKLAATDLAGVMVWELGQDTTGDYAMINTIHNQFQELKMRTSDDFCGLTEQEIFEIQNAEFKKKVNITPIKKNFAIVYDDLKNKTIAVTKNSFIQSYIKSKFPNQSLYLALSTAEALNAVSYGKAAAAIGSLPTLSYYIQKDWLSNIKTIFILFLHKRVLSLFDYLQIHDRL